MMEAASTEEGSDVEMEEEYLDDNFEEETVTATWQEAYKSCMIEVTVDPLAVPDRMEEEAAEPNDNESLEKEPPLRKHLCVKCKKQFGTQEAYKAHIARAHATSRLCGACGVSFLNELGLRLHTMRKHPGTLAEQSTKGAVWCVECKAHFADSAAYTLHARVCRPSGHAPHPGVCPTCDSPAEVCHQHRPAIHCELCGESMANNRVYQQHFRRVHPDENGTLRPAPPPQCGRCGKVLSTGPQRRRRRHVCRATEPPPLACITCGLRFHCSDDLSLHVATHVRNRSHGCVECGREFNSEENLKRHSESHQQPISTKRSKQNQSPEFEPRIEDVRNIELCNEDAETVEPCTEEVKTVLELRIEDVKKHIEDTKTVLLTPSEGVKTVLEPCIADARTVLVPRIEDTTVLDTRNEDAKTVLEPRNEDAKTLLETRIEEAKTVLETRIEDAKTVLEPRTEEATVLESRIEDAKTVLEPRIEGAKTVLEPRTEDATVLEPRTEDTTVLEPRIEDATVLEPRIEDAKTVLKSRTEDPTVLDPRIQDVTVLETEDAKTVLETRIEDTRAGLEPCNYELRTAEPEVTFQSSEGSVDGLIGEERNMTELVIETADRKEQDLPGDTKIKTTLKTDTDK